MQSYREKTGKSYAIRATISPVPEGTTAPGSMVQKEVRERSKNVARKKGKGRPKKRSVHSRMAGASSIDRKYAVPLMFVAGIKKLARTTQAERQEDSNEFEYIAHDNDYESGDEGEPQCYDEHNCERTNNLLDSLSN